MKRTFCLLLCCLVFLLSACGVPQLDYFDLLEENASLSEENASLQAEVESLKSERENGTETRYLQSEIKSLSNGTEYDKNEPESTDIIAGDLYDSVSAIHSDISLTEIEKNIYINIYLNDEGVLENSTRFFDVVVKIIENSNLKKYYSSATFSMLVDNSLVSILTILDYSSSDSYTSESPTTLKEEYKEPIDTLYSIAFLSSDVLNDYDKYLDELREKYNLSK